MKTTAIIFIILISTFSTQAQRLKLEDLRFALQTNNLDKIQYYLLKKKLTFEEKSKLDDKDPVTLVYSFSSGTYEKLDFLYFDVNQINNQIFTASIATRLKEEFIALRNAAEILGYKTVSSSFKDNVSFTDLKLNDYRLTFVDGTKEVGKVYQIFLTDIKLESYLFSLQN